MGLKGKRLTLRLAVHSLVLALLLLFIYVGTLADSPGTSGFFGLIFLGYLVTLKVNPIARLLERKVFQEIECSACGQTIELMDSWNCGCGFITWEPRHALAPCPVCKKEFQWLQCPSCENGIQT
jgi:hypothetical protein